MRNEIHCNDNSLNTFLAYGDRGSDSGAIPRVRLSRLMWRLLNIERAGGLKASVFEQIDTNKDTKISKEEMVKYMGKLDLLAVSYQDKVLAASVTLHISLVIKLSDFLNFFVCVKQPQ